MSLVREVGGLLDDGGRLRGVGWERVDSKECMGMMGWSLLRCCGLYNGDRKGAGWREVGAVAGRKNE